MATDTDTDIPLGALPLTSPESTPLNQLPASTDKARWRLSTPGLGTPDVGRHVWTYLKQDDSSQTLEDKHWLGLPTNQPDLPKATTASQAAENGYLYYSKVVQSTDGHFACEYGGPLFLMPGLIIGSYVTETAFPDEWRIEMTRYLKNRQNKDGGWGLHIAGPSTVFGTSCNYVALRLLGNGPDEPFMTKARNLLHSLGGTKGVPSWGKLWLSVLGVYDWEGLNPIPPELWLLPDWVPIHPWRWWIHTRMVYIPMGWLWGCKWTYPNANQDPIIASLRQELYTEDYDSIHWPSQRSNIAEVDIFAPHTNVLKALMKVMGYYAKFTPNLIRSAGLQQAYNLLKREDENTGYQCLGPVNKMLNQVVRYAVDGSNSDAMRHHRDKMRDFIWMGEDGMSMCGTNGAQLWDTAFIAQAVSSTTTLVENPRIRPSIQAILRWLDDTQIRENPQHYRSCYRHATKGAWPFSTKQQGYTVSDCTAEGLKAVCDLQSPKMGLQPLVPLSRLRDTVDLLLSMQNPSGGFASYEKINGPGVLEWINPAEVFGNIMIEYDYPECTTSVVGGLCKFRQVDPEYRKEDIENTIQGAVKYIFKAQRQDGSWFGSWAVCFTYSTMFALESLHLAGYNYKNCAAVRKACEFLLSKQNTPSNRNLPSATIPPRLENDPEVGRGTDGGWSEHFDSCVVGEYIPLNTSRLVQTSWAIIALLHAEYPHKEAILPAVHFLMSKQERDGSWKEDHPCVGVFNRNCGILYPNYRFSFVIWALGKVASRFQL
ncbi:unnamed protein product [Sympodiomycopsis kandeliae]